MQILTVRKGLKHSNATFNQSKHSNANSKNLKVFERYSKHSNASSNHSKGIRSVRMQILTIRIGFEAFKCKFESFEWDSKRLNANSNLRTGFEAFECKF